MIEVAIVSLPVEGAGLVMKELFRDPLRLAVREDHPLASEEKVHLRRLCEERLLILKDGHCLRDETLSICDRGRARFAGQFEADQVLTIFELIRAGFGVSIVPEMVRGLSQGCRLLEIEPKASRRIGYVRLERRYLSKAHQSFTAVGRTCGACEAARSRTRAGMPPTPSSGPRCWETTTRRPSSPARSRVS